MTLTIDQLFWGLIVMGLFFTWFSSQRRDILLSLVAGLLWFTMAMWLFFSPGPFIGLTDDWQKILLWVFIILTFVPFLIYMNTEIKYEKDGRGWVEYGEKPNYENTVNAYEDYKKELQRRVSKGRRR